MIAQLVGLAVLILAVLTMDMVEQIGRAALPCTGCPARRASARDRFAWARPDANHWHHRALLAGVWTAPVLLLPAGPIGQPRTAVAA